MIGLGLLGLRRATPRAPSARRTPAFDAVASVELTEPARSVLVRFRGSHATRVVRCASSPRWLAGRASPRPNSDRTPSVARAALTTTETSLLATDAPASPRTSSLTCPDNGRAASRAHSRKRARSAAPKVPSTPKTPTRGAVCFQSVRAFDGVMPGSEPAPLRSSLGAAHGRCDGCARTRPRPRPGVSRTSGDAPSVSEERWPQRSSELLRIERPAARISS